MFVLPTNLLHVPDGTWPLHMYMYCLLLSSYIYCRLTLVYHMYGYLLEVTKQQMCMKYILFKWFVLPVARLMLKCWSLYKLVVYFQQGHCPSYFDPVACPRPDSMRPCRAHAVLSGTCNIYGHVFIKLILLSSYATGRLSVEQRRSRGRWGFLQESKNLECCWNNLRLHHLWSSGSSCDPRFPYKWKQWRRRRRR